MADKFFALTVKESNDEVGYDYIKKNESRLVTVDYEFGSIDFGLMSPTRFILDDVCYQIKRQYIKLGSTSDRILVGSPVLTASENPDLVATPTTYEKPYYLTALEKQDEDDGENKENGETDGGIGGKEPGGEDPSTTPTTPGQVEDQVG